MNEIDYLGVNDLVFHNDIKEGIHSGGFSVNSALMKSGLSPIMTLNTEKVGGSNNVSDLFNDLVIPYWALSYNNKFVGGKYENDYTSTVQVLPSAPRTLTQSQIYSINEINKSHNNITNYLSKAPTSSDILAIIPIKTSTGVPTGSLIVDFSGSLQDNVRTYFGPVNIERMCVKLLDDKGNILNLNGNDWCVTLVCECLYQY
jgi:hypothetical protein